MRSSVVAFVLLAAPAVAHAGEPIGVAVDVTTGAGTYTGDLGAAHRSPHLRVGLGVARGPWAALVSVEMPSLFGVPEAQSAAQPAPPVIDLLGVGVGPSLRRELTRGPGLRAHVRVGYSWRWLYGSTTVRRTCQVHGGCAGGFWHEEPSYPAHGPTLALGVSWRFRGAVWPAVGVELAAGRTSLDRLGHDPDLTGTYVSLGLNVAVGR